MGNPRLIICHLASAGVDPIRMDIARRLAVTRAANVHHAFVFLGAGEAPDLERPWQRLAVPGGWSRLATLRLAHWLMQAGPGPVVLHAWTPEAVVAALPLVTTHRPLLVDWPPGSPGRRLQRWLREGVFALVCSARTTRAALLAGGLPAARLLFVPPIVDAEAWTEAEQRRGALRAALELPPEARLAVFLPPLGTNSGALYAGWAGLLVQKTCPHLRVLVPEIGPGFERVRRLYQACRHNFMLRAAPAHWRPADLVATADVALHLPLGPVAVDALVVAAAAQLPLVVSRDPHVREALGERAASWCTGGVPRSAAQALLSTLEGPARVPAARALGQAPEVVLARYQGAYQRLMERRSLVGLD